MPGSMYVTGPFNRTITLYSDTLGEVYQEGVTLANRINNGINKGRSIAVDMTFVSSNPSYTELIPFTPDDADKDANLIGCVPNSASYNIKLNTGNTYPYIVIGNSSAQSYEILSTQVTLVGGGKRSVTLLSGRNSGINYITQGESGKIINTAGSLQFSIYANTNTKGNWSIYSSSGNDLIHTTNGNNTIHAGTGNNTIVLGSGRNIVKSEGQDTITANNGGYQTITLSGGQSTVTVGDGSYISDISNNNIIHVGQNSIVNGGANGIISYDGGDLNAIQGGNNNTISASNNTTLKIVHGRDNNYNIDGNIIFLNGDGNTNAAVTGRAVIFGANGLNFNFIQNNTHSSSSSIFIADQGNETLNASNYNNSILIYANTVAGAQTTLNATGSNNDDTLVAGTGNSTFTGGGGNNLFMFTKETDINGDSVITDFTTSSQNKIAFVHYGFNNDDITHLLQNAQNKNGNTLMNLDNHHITLQGVTTSDLHSDQFIIMN